MKKRFLKSFIGVASLSLLLSACNLMPGMNQGGGDSEINTVDGERGSSLLTGRGAPSSDLGEIGDLYLDLTNYDLYVKGQNGWSKNGSLKGQDGKDGKDGKDGEDGKDGQDGKDGEDGKDGADAEQSDMGLVFFEINDNEYSVGAGTAKYYHGEIEIPATFNDKPVTAISGDGFKNSSITSIIIPEGVTTIGEHAFDGCANLGSVTLPSSLTTISSRAFVNCTSLNSISLSNVTYIGEWAFGGCFNLMSVSLSTNLYTIGEGAFYDCSRLTELTYDGNKTDWEVISLGQYWFLGTGLKTVKCKDGSFNINQYNEEVMVSLDTNYHLVGGYDNNNWAPNNDNKMNAASIRQIYNIDNKLGSKLSEKDIKHLYMRQIQVGSLPQDWTAKTFYKNKVREVNGDLTFRVSESIYNPQEDLYSEARYIPDNGNFSMRNKAEALTDNIFIPTYQSEIDENGFCWNNSCVMNVQDGTYIFVMAEYDNVYNWSSDARFGFGLITISGGNLITNDPLDDETETPDTTKTYTGIYLNEDGSEFARSSANSLAQLSAYNKFLPTKASEGNLQYGFNQWELVSNVDNVVTFKPKFDSCTRGLQFENNAVYQYTGLTEEVIIPSKWDGKQITTISNRAFQSTNITSVNIPNTITKIDNQAFEGCKKLTSVVVPDSVTTLGNAAFSDCTSLVSASLSNNLTSISGNLFLGCEKLASVIIPNRATTIEYQAFYGCKKINNITIPNGVTNIDSSAFAYSGLTKIIIPNSVKTIGNSAFAWCSNLTSVTLSNSLKNLYSDAFSGDQLLKSIVIPDSLTYVGGYAFNNCPNLVIYMTLEYKPKDFDQYWSGDATVVYGYKETIVMGDYTFALAQIEDHKFAQLINFDTKNVVNFEIPSNVNGYDVTSISTGAFKNNTTLKSVVLPNTVTEISSEMFKNCINLESITIPESVTKIGDNAFNSCRSLQSINLPDSVKSIGNGAFYSCTSLQTIRMSDNIEEVAEGAFSNCNALEYNEYENGRYLGNENNQYLVYFRYSQNPTINEKCKVIAGGWNGNESFYRNLLIIPDSVVYIGYGAFSYSKQLYSVVIGSGVKIIKNQAFQDCTVSTVFYKGTKEDWSNISIEDYNDTLIYANRYYYSETEPTEDGNYWHYVDDVPTIW